MPLHSGQIIIIDILSPSTNDLIYYTLSNTINVHVKVQNYPFGGGDITHIYVNMDILSKFGFLGYLNYIGISVNTLPYM